MASASTSTSAADDVDKLLSREATAFQRDVEVERILKAFKLNPYDILDLDDNCTPEDVKKRYRQLSLFIHPDKCKHTKAPEAFDTLKKAESELSDQLKREDLDAVINAARADVLINMGLSKMTPFDDPKLKNLTPPFKAQVRTKSRDLLIEEELRRRKAVKNNLANEGLEERKKEEEVNSRKRKAEQDKNWEENRDTRVDSWRTFANSKKKKKTKVQVLG